MHRAVGRPSMGRSRSALLPMAATACESPNAEPVDMWTTQGRCPHAHRLNSSRPEQNEKCVTHVAGQNCHPCPRLLKRGREQTEFAGPSDVKSNEQRSMKNLGELRLDLPRVGLDP